MATKGMEALDAASLQALLGPELTAEQAALIFRQGQEAVVFALLTLAKQLAEKQAVASAPNPSTPSGQAPPYTKPSANRRAKAKGAKPGHPGHRRPAPTRIDHREEHRLSACPKCHGPVRPCRSSRTRVVEDIPTDITPVVTEHTIHRYWCPQCKNTVEPVMADALPGSTIGLRVVVLSAWLHYLLGTTLAQIIDVFNFHLQFKLSSGGLVQMWHRLREILLAWYLEIQAQALNSAVLHADETGWRVNGKTYWLWCFTSKDVTYYMIDRRRGSPALKKFFKKEFAGVLVTDFSGAYNAVVCAEAEMPAAPAAGLETDTALPQARRRLARVLQTIETPDPRLDPFEQTAWRVVGGPIRIAAETLAAEASRPVGSPVAGETLSSIGQAIEATRDRAVHFPGASRRSLRQQPRGATNSTGCYRAEEQLRQWQRRRSRNAGDPDECVPNSQAAQSQPYLRGSRRSSGLPENRPATEFAGASH